MKPLLRDPIGRFGPLNVRSTDAITVAQVSERFVFSTRRRPRTLVRLKSLQYLRHLCPADSQITGECRPVFERAAKDDIMFNVNQQGPPDGHGFGRP